MRCVSHVFHVFHDTLSLSSFSIIFEWTHSMLEPLSTSSWMMKGIEEKLPARREKKDTVIVKTPPETNKSGCLLFRQKQRKHRRNVMSEETVACTESFFLTFFVLLFWLEQPVTGEVVLLKQLRGWIIVKVSSCFSLKKDVFSEKREEPKSNMNSWLLSLDSVHRVLSKQSKGRRRCRDVTSLMYIVRHKRMSLRHNLRGEKMPLLSLFLSHKKVKVHCSLRYVPLLLLRVWQEEGWGEKENMDSPLGSFGRRWRRRKER